ncbi:MAG: hypothetical protein JWL77_3989 [Chthonomonadaceae bacterium]|nr:hypothetical protein [Chthonomonadaceae bacterium]
MHEERIEPPQDETESRLERWKNVPATEEVAPMEGRDASIGGSKRAG